MSSLTRIRVCFALEREAAPFRCLLARSLKSRNGDDRHGIEVLVTGMGPAMAATRLASRLLEKSPGCVLTCGLAGALAPNLRCGEVLHQTSATRLSAQLAATGSREATFLCTEDIASTASDKHHLRRDTGADAVEMESGAIQRLCAERGVPCATVRAISDDAASDLPLDFNKLRGPDLQLSNLRLAGAILARPWAIPGLIRLGRNSAAASRSLAGVLAQLISTG